jgi:heat shock protein HslJ
LRRSARLAGLGLMVQLVVAAIACRQPPTPAGPADFRATVAGADWELMELAGKPAPTGAGGRRATIRFEADTSRVTGFAGCNRYFGTYMVEGKTIRFGPIGMTRMACAEGMTLERELGTALEAARSYEIGQFELAIDRDRVGEVDRLTLVGSGGPVARFERRTP